MPRTPMEPPDRILLMMVQQYRVHAVTVPLEQPAVVVLQSVTTQPELRITTAMP